MDNYIQTRISILRSMHGIACALYYEQEKDSDDLWIFSNPADAASSIDVVYRLYGDIALYCRILVEKHADCIDSICVDRKLLESFGLSEDELFKAALESAPVVMPAKLLPAEQVLHFDEEEETESNTMMMLTTSSIMFGASTLFYPGMLASVADQLDGSYFILPSSRSELIIVKENESIDPKELQNMVYKVNRSPLVSDNDFLSDSVFYYNKQKGCLGSFIKLEYQLADDCLPFLLMHSASGFIIEKKGELNYGILQ